MLKRLVIKNFQSIESLDIELDKITIIKGASDVGKSAIIRAIQCLIQNKYSKNFTTVGKGNCRIEIYTEEGDVIKFFRNGKTKYELNDRPYTNVARDVPHDIGFCLRMGKTTFSEDVELDVSIQKQFDPPFLLEEGGTRVAKVIGKMSNLNNIFVANTLGTKELNALNSRKRTLTQIIDRDEDELQALSYVEELRTRADRLTDMVSAIKRNNTKREALNALVLRWHSNQRTIQNVDTDILDIDTRTATSLLDAAKQQQETTNKVRQLEGRLKELNDIDTTPPQEINCLLLESVLDGLTYKKRQLSTIATDLDDATEHLAQLESISSKDESEAASILDEANTNMDGTLCPLIGDLLLPECQVRLQQQAEKAVNA